MPMCILHREPVLIPVPDTASGTQGLKLLISGLMQREGSRPIGLLPSEEGLAPEVSCQ